VNPSALDCADCEARLVDLVDAHRAGDADLRRRIDGLLKRCPDCERQFTVLAEGLAWANELPEVEPPRQIDAVVMAAARARAAAVRPAAERPRGIPGAVEEGGFWDRLVQKLGALAMRPQVTMATLTVLVVTLGVWALRPTDQRAALPEAGSVSVAPDPMGEAVPSYTPAPEELARAGRPGPGTAPPAGRRAEAVTGEADPAQALVEGAPREEPRGADGRGAAAASPGATEDDGRNEELGALAQVAAEDLRDRSATRGRRAEAAPRPPAGAAGDRASREPRRAEGFRNLGGDPARREEAPAPTSPSAASRRPAPPAASVWDEEASAAPADVLDGEPPSPPPPTGVPTLASELHADARAARRAGRTAQAIRTYENLLARFPSYLRRGQALLELGDAYRAAGRSDDARNAYRRAGRHPGLGATAERRLVRLDDGGSRSPATADRADEAGAEAEEEAEGDGSSSSEGEEGEPPEEAD
jgi:hypothetical protein